MPNALTGDFDAVVRVSSAVIGNLIRLIHGNGIDANLSPSFPHFVRIRVGRQRVEEGLRSIQSWVWTTERQYSVKLTNRNIKEYVTHLPPGVAQATLVDFERYSDRIKPQVRSAALSGVAEIQCGAPILPVQQSGSAVVARVPIRARYQPDPGSYPLPEWVNGEISVRHLLQLSGNTLSVVPDPEDGGFDFIPASGSALSATDIKKIRKAISDAIRHDFYPMSINLPGALPVAGFKWQMAGNQQLLALPIGLQGAVPTGDVQSIPDVAGSGSSLTVSISRHYLDGVFAPVLASIKQAVEAIVIPVDAKIFSTEYRGSMKSGPFLVWHDGSLTLSGEIDLKTDSILWNQTMSFSQNFTLDLNVVSQKFELRPMGEPTIQASAYEDRARTEFIKVRDQSMGGVGASITSMMRQGLDRFTSAIRMIDQSATTRFQSLTLSPQGIVVKCAAHLSSPPEPVVMFEETATGSAYSAMKSWVPGGSIDWFSWSWGIGFYDFVHGRSIATSVDYSDRWIVTKAETIDSGITTINGTVGDICLLINDSAGQSCGPSGTRANIPMPIKWWHWELFVPKKAYWDDDRGNAIVDEAITAHGNWQFDTSPDGRFGSNQIVHFVDLSKPGEVAAMRASLAAVADGRTPVSAMMVLPQQTLANISVDKLNKGLGIGRSAPAPMRHSRSATREAPPEANFEITEDYESSWTRVFRKGGKKAPTTFVINAKGEFVWSGSPGEDKASWAKALKGNLSSTSGVRQSRDALRVDVGNTVLPARFVDVSGRAIELKRLRGQRMLIAFIQQWSRPCMKELEHLDRLAKENDQLTVIAVDCSRQGAKQKGSTTDSRLIWVVDDDRKLQQEFGVQVWPTTISVNPYGLVDRIQRGMTIAKRKTSVAKAVAKNKGR